MVESSRSRKRAGSFVLREVRVPPAKTKDEVNPRLFRFSGLFRPDQIEPVENDGPEFGDSISYVAKSGGKSAW